jgi:hypothetical protein
MINPVENNGATVRQDLCYHEPLLIGVPRAALRDLKLRPILVYSVGDVLQKELETIPLLEILPTKHIAPPYIVTVLLK